MNQSLAKPIADYVDASNTFDTVPNPLVLTFYFNVRDARISQLIILQNK
jgi:hypothetical protein